MAALRQLLNAKELMGASYPRALPEESRQMVKEKMEAMGYPLSPPAVPVKEQSHESQNLRPVKYNKQDATVNKAGSSYEDYDRSIYASIYEERLSRDMTPTPRGSLPYRPNPGRNNSETQLNKSIYNQRRRSRSASQDQNPWETYNMNQSRGLTRRDSGRSSSQPPGAKEKDSAGSGSMQTLQDRQRSPPVNNSGFEPLSSIGHPKKRNTKNTTSSTFNPVGSNHSTASQVDSVASGVKHTIPPLDRTSRKRSIDMVDLDYTPSQLESKTFADLAAEPFDHNPPSFFTENSLTKRLPSPSLPLVSRLQAVYDSSTSRVSLAKTMFASMPIESYEECGDVLIEKFTDLMERLRQARRTKRKACMAMEEEIAAREKWVRRKRGCVEDGLDQLRTTGMSVIKPRAAKVG